MAWPDIDIVMDGTRGTNLKGHEQFLNYCWFGLIYTNLNMFSGDHPLLSTVTLQSLWEATLIQ